MIKLRNISKHYGQLIALNNINLDINRGEMVMIAGPSGAGKSTLMKLLYREIKASEGQIVIGNIDVSAISISKIPQLRRHMGIIFQDFKLLENKTVFENVAFCLRALGAEEYEVQRRVNGALKLVGLADRAYSFPHELSGGEQQRVGIARAIVQGPPLLIADEPTGNLDPSTSLEIFHLLERIAQRGTTILISTHNQKIIEQMGKRVILLRDGNIVDDIPAVKSNYSSIN